MQNNHWNKKNLLLIAVYVIGFGIGTISHTMDMVKLGFLGYTFAPFVLNVFWTSLLILDPLVIVLLLVHFRYAITLAVLIMIFDIVINLSYGVAVGNRNILLGLATQIPFGCFVFLTAKHLSRYMSIASCLKW
ncbi:hypothetical protein JWG40_17955 [Leptospira sp. 201903074]|uniref:hypothetical protein n=1 Tax=Leptospira abararensis TaxID=2810036 RepID=UPI001964E2BA|nr:hypothetical protein [Leptospira abararensis]MBM9548916.1 hypothetical protein [Leptospira abararensis]